MTEIEVLGRLRSKAANIKGNELTQMALSRRMLEDKLQKIEIMKIEQDFKNKK